MSETRAEQAERLRMWARAFSRYTAKELPGAPQAILDMEAFEAGAKALELQEAAFQAARRITEGQDKERRTNHAGGL